MTLDADTPLLFLHAFPLNAGMWRRQVEAFGRRPSLAPDLPGFGGTPPGDADLDTFARTVLLHMDAARMERAVVVGLSMGGYVAFRLHALAPERVAGLVLADTRAGADDEAGRTKRTDQAARVRADGVEWMPDAFVPALLGVTTRERRPDVVSEVGDMIASAQPEGVARALEAMRDRPDATPDLEGIRVPVLALAGEEDTLTPPAEARRIAEGVARGRLEILPGAGHLANLETPDLFNEALRRFLG